MRYTDLMEFKNDPIRKEVIRERIGRCIERALREEFGSDYVLFMENEVICATGDMTEQKFPKNTIVADFGDITDKDGFERGGIAHISVKVIGWNDVRTAKTDRTALTFDDIVEGKEKAEKLAKEKAEKEKAKAESKARKIEHDKAIREKKRAENKAKKGE